MVVNVGYTLVDFLHMPGPSELEVVHNPGVGILFKALQVILMYNWCQEPPSWITSGASDWKWQGQKCGM